MNSKEEPSRESNHWRSLNQSPDKKISQTTRLHNSHFRSGTQAYWWCYGRWELGKSHARGSWTISEEWRLEAYRITTRKESSGW